MTSRTALLAASFLLPLALAGCGGLRNEATALGLADTPQTTQRLELSPEDSYARGREAEAAGNFEAAEQYYIAAANAGSTGARVNLGAMYLAGRGVNRDYAEALHWLEPAARAGNAEAQARVGLIYETGGIGVTRAPDTALMWYERAAAQGNAAAQANLGYMSLDGDPGAAAAWFKRSAEQGDASAMMGLATLCEAGRGVPKDPVQAAKWYALASVDDGEYDEALFAGARKARTALAAKMTPAQVAQADQLARDFTPTAKR